MMILDTVRSDTMLELPPLSLYSMTKPQLEEFIPRLINLSSSVTSPQPSEAESNTCFFKPDWWPVDVPWSAPRVDDQHKLCEKFSGRDFESTDKLRSVVEACYAYMGHKDLLTPHRTNMEPDIDCFKDNTEVVAVESSSDDDSETEVVDVYVCFYCDHWFGGKEGKAKLEEHVLTHMNAAQDRPGACKEPITVPLVGTPAVSSPPCQPTKKPKPLLPKKRKRLPEIPLWKRPDLPSNCGVSENEFLKSFGLISSKQAKTVSVKSSVDIDCEIVAVEGLASRPLTSPRTPKSLMSQLSRDGEGSSRKRLSFAVQDDGSDGETPDTSPNKNIQGALLNVAFSSLLGKRVKKHIKADSFASTIKDPEEFCSTLHLRNEFLDKLRYRCSDYPITYKKKRKQMAKYSHYYKFNRDQRSEFMKKMKTGLNKESRSLRRQMVNCQVILKRIAQEQIDFWKQKRKCHGAEWIDDDISIVEIEPAPRQVDHSRLYRAGPSGVIRQVPTRPMHMHPRRNVNMLQNKAPYLMQQLTSPQASTYSPRTVPQFLVKKVEKQFNGHQSSKLVYVPISEVQSGPQKRIEPRWNPNQQCSQQSQGAKNWGPNTMVADRRKLGPLSVSRRKQHFVNVRKDLDTDSDVSIHSQSSDEDIREKKVSKPPLPIASRDQNTIAPQKHMVMSASGEFVKTVAQKARKSFNKTKQVLTPQMVMHFTSHPIGSQAAPVSPGTQPRGSVVPKPVPPSLSPAIPNRAVAKQSVPQTKTQVRPTLKPPQQSALHIVDDVIYIDDD